jgi:lactoylglutathione lyase
MNALTFSVLRFVSFRISSRVDDLPACVAHLTKEGMRFTPGGIRKGASGFDVCFVHPKGNEQTPKSGEGVLIELVQAPAEVIAANKK